MLDYARKMVYNFVMASTLMIQAPQGFQRILFLTDGKADLHLSLDPNFELEIAENALKTRLESLEPNKQEVDILQTWIASAKDQMGLAPTGTLGGVSSGEDYVEPLSGVDAA